eukprot:3481165-Rhodomonas_salina.1
MKFSAAVTVLIVLVIAVVHSSPPMRTPALKAPELCAGAFGGVGCESCTDNMWGKACNIQCERYDSCSGNGRCRF